ncbi:unnamed protein product, partial [Brassica oleracea]
RLSEQIGRIVTGPNLNYFNFFSLLQVVGEEELRQDVFQKRTKRKRTERSKAKLGRVKREYHTSNESWPKSENSADLFTKSLPSSTFRKFTQQDWHA